jgi:hypothetical protein
VFVNELENGFKTVSVDVNDLVELGPDYPIYIYIIAYPLHFSYQLHLLIVDLVLVYCLVLCWMFRSCLVLDV